MIVRSNGVRVTAQAVVSDEDAERFHDLYEAAFGPLRTLAAARQVLYRDEFFREMRDSRVTKYVAWAPDGRPIGLSALSTDLSTVPWISPEFYAHKFPEHSARNAIFYVHFMLAEPGGARQGGLDALFDTLVEICVARQVVALYDVCAFNDEDRRLGQKFRTRMESSASVLVSKLDTQTYYSAEFTGLPMKTRFMSAGPDNRLNTPTARLSGPPLM